MIDYNMLSWRQAACRSRSQHGAHTHKHHKQLMNWWTHFVSLPVAHRPASRTHTHAHIYNHEINLETKIDKQRFIIWTLWFDWFCFARAFDVLDKWVCTQSEYSNQCLFIRESRLRIAQRNAERLHTIESIHHHKMTRFILVWLFVDRWEACAHVSHALHTPEIIVKTVY